LKAKLVYLGHPQIKFEMVPINTLLFGDNDGEIQLSKIALNIGMISKYLFEIKNKYETLLVSHINNLAIK
jgi:hypothetical protein